MPGGSRALDLYSAEYATAQISEFEELHPDAGCRSLDTPTAELWEEDGAYVTKSSDLPWTLTSGHVTQQTTRTTRAQRLKREARIARRKAELGVMFGSRAARGDVKLGREPQEAYVQDFKLFLIRKYGDLVRAWRVAIDPDEHWSVSWGGFCQAINRTGYQSKGLKELWTALDGDRGGSITIEELDWEGAKRLARFRQLMVRTYGSVRKAFEHGLDPQNTGRFHLPELQSVLQLLQPRKWHPRTCWHLFQGLDRDGLGSVTLDEIATIERLKLDEVVEAAQEEAKHKQEEREFYHALKDVPTLHAA
jgi:hypothetical protein